MKRLNVTAEGHSEEKFCRDILSEYLVNQDIIVDARRVLTKRDKFKQHRGGIVKYEKFKRDINNWLKEDTSHEVRFTTMIDLYGLPNDFPGYNNAIKKIDIYERAFLLEKALAEDINDYRFIPYIQVYEFEAMVFTNPEIIMYEYFDRQKETIELKKMVVENKNNPELINDKMPPSHRIEKLIPEYDKVNVGNMVLKSIGIQNIRNSCKHFNDWLLKLESI